MSRNLREIREEYEKRNGQRLTKREERERIVKRTRQKSAGENEGVDQDLRYSKYGERRIYSELEIQNNINWNTYKTSKSYREKVNYYFFQAKHSLRDVKYLGKIDNNGENKKYVSKTGEEIILDENNKVVYDSATGGIYNYYSYPVNVDLWNGDKRRHKLDIDL